jgi:hypothetical protein
VARRAAVVEDAGVGRATLHVVPCLSACGHVHAKAHVVIADISVGATHATPRASQPCSSVLQDITSKEDHAELYRTYYTVCAIFPQISSSHNQPHGIVKGETPGGRPHPPTLVY